MVVCSSFRCSTPLITSSRSRAPLVRRRRRSANRPLGAVGRGQSSLCRPSPTARAFLEDHDFDRTPKSFRRRRSLQVLASVSVAIGSQLLRRVQLGHLCLVGRCVGRPAIPRHTLLTVVCWARDKARALMLFARFRRASRTISRRPKAGYELKRARSCRRRREERRVVFVRELRPQTTVSAEPSAFSALVVTGLPGCPASWLARRRRAS